MSKRRASTKGLHKGLPDDIPLAMLIPDQYQRERACGALQAHAKNRQRGKAARRARRVNELQRRRR